MTKTIKAKLVLLDLGRDRETVAGGEKSMGASWLGPFCLQDEA